MNMDGWMHAHIVYPSMLTNKYMYIEIEPQMEVSIVEKPQGNLSLISTASISNYSCWGTAT